MSYTALDHVGFTVGDLARAVEFYSFLLAREPVQRLTWDRGFIGEVVGYSECTMECALWHLTKATVLELIQYGTPRPRRVDLETINVGNAHLCLLAEDLDAEYERLADYVAFRSPRPVVIPSGPYKGGRVCYFRDPDGISVELLEKPRQY